MDSLYIYIWQPSKPKHYWTLTSPNTSEVANTSAMDTQMVVVDHPKDEVKPNYRGPTQLPGP